MKTESAIRLGVGLAGERARGRVELAAPRVEQRRHGPARARCGRAQRRERRHARDGTALVERERLHAGEADAKPGERARPDRDGEGADGVERGSREREQPVDGRQQPLGVQARVLAS